jgi:predicted ester cyclase
MKKLNMILSLGLFLCFSVGCQDKAEMAELEALRAQAEVEEQNKALVIQLYEELGKGNIEKAFEVFASDYRLYYPSNAESPITKEQNFEMALKTKQAFPDTVYEIKDIVAVGDKVIVRGIDKSTHTQEFQGRPPTGKKLEVSWLSIIRFEEGKIVETWQEFDSLGWMQLLGYEIKPKEGKK